MKEYWDAEALTSFDFQVDEDNNTSVIIDDICAWIVLYIKGLQYLESILIVSRRHNLSWKLKKCDFFPEKVEFVGHNLTQRGNQPAHSKDPLLKNWRDPEYVRDISSFIGFGHFYSRYIPYFEERIQHLRSIIKNREFTSKIKPSDWIGKGDKECADIKEAILLLKPLLRRVDKNKPIYLRTDFSAKGMGYVILQPGDDAESIAAML